MEILDQEKKDRILFEYGQLFKCYGWTLTKFNLKDVLGISERKLDTMVVNGTAPKFKKLGDAPNSRIVFFTYDVAVWMSD